MRHVIAVDPGKMTGIAVFSMEKDGTNLKLLESVEVDEEEYADYIQAWIDKHPDIEVACERFLITAETAKKSQAPFSLELIGILKHLVRTSGRSITEIKMQTPADAKALFPNPALKKLGYWHVGGAGHALDAIRHGLLYCMRNSDWKPSGLLT